MGAGCGRPSLDKSVPGTRCLGDPVHRRYTTPGLNLIMPGDAPKDRGHSAAARTEKRKRREEETTEILEEGRAKPASDAAKGRHLDRVARLQWSDNDAARRVYFVTP